MMKHRLLLVPLMVTLLVTLLIAPVASAATPAAPATGSLTATLTNVPIANGTSAGTFTGTLQATNFVVQNGQLVAQGTISGLVTYTSGLLAGTTQTVPSTTTFSAPVTGGTGSCTILNLTIGPINLDLLGLVIQTNTIHLQITAQQGSGNLLGNLLCAVANLLNGNTSGSALQQLANLLNQILGAL